jgi:ABC-2 type transport system ATP-binding protein
MSMAPKPDELLTKDMTSPALEITDLHKRYGETTALAGVSLRVESGELFGLLGPNGAGKTTLLNIAAGLVAASSGCAAVFGEPVSPDDRELRRVVGIVPQEIALYAELSARENLEFFGKLYGLSRNELHRRADELLDAVGLTDRAADRVGTFSGGMKRRLNLGVALMHSPRLLLLDEPTTGVDPHSRNHIFEEVRRLHASGVTVIYTSHYLEEVQALCPRVGILDRGRLIACETMADLLRQAHGVIRFRVADVTPDFRQRLQCLPDVRLIEREDRPLEMVCRDVDQTLLALVNAVSELKLDLLDLETEEPNLERVFLDLTNGSENGLPH